MIVRYLFPATTPFWLPTQTTLNVCLTLHTRCIMPTLNVSIPLHIHVWLHKTVKHLWMFSHFCLLTLNVCPGTKVEVLYLDFSFQEFYHISTVRRSIQHYEWGFSTKLININDREINDFIWYSILRPLFHVSKNIRIKRANPRFAKPLQLLVSFTECETQLSY